jgi:hypothetical protein
MWAEFIAERVRDWIGAVGSKTAGKGACKSSHGSGGMIQLRAA